MTKEELEKEAEEYANNLTFVFETDIVQRIVRERVRLALIDVLEPREKQIAELEHQLTHRNCLDCSNHSSKLRMRTLELEKENAELSMKRKAERKIFQGIVEKKNDQLTKAKEIIKELVRVEYADFTNGDYSNELSKVLEQAEQFLSEVEK